MAVGVAIVAAGTWGWRASLVRVKPVEPSGDQWEHVREKYPLPEEPADLSPIAPGTAEAIISANPFSQKRRALPPPAELGTSGTPGEVPEPERPQFAYKGRIAVGSRERAIVENLTTHKTHFLELGQEVAGFKVLDIDENRVVLSDPQTHQEVVLSVTSKASP